MLDAELAKEVKKDPVVEFEIPKRVSLEHDVDSSQQDTLMVRMWNFS